MLANVYKNLVYEHTVGLFPALTEGSHFLVVAVALAIIGSLLFDRYLRPLLSKANMPYGINTEWTVSIRDQISDTILSYVTFWNEYLLYAKTVLLHDASATQIKREENIINDALISIPSIHGVPSIIKSLECAIFILSMARSADKLLTNNSTLDDFLSLLNQIAVNLNSTREKLKGLNILCIEGQPCSGKSTLVLGLVMKAGAIVVESFDSSLLSQIRMLFSQSPEPVSTALEYALNYCTAYRIVTATAAATAHNGSKQLVIVDEFYHSICARTVCTNVGSEVDLKSLPASAFEWPLDLPTPTLVMFLSLSSKERSKRRLEDVNRAPSPRRPIATRFSSSSAAPLPQPMSDRVMETEIEWSDLDDRTVMAYSLITGPPTIALDASLSAEEVLSAALEACEEFRIFIPKPVVKKKSSKRISMGFYGELARF